MADDGHRWVQRITWDRAGLGRVFDVFDPEGRYLGAVRLPFAVQGWTPIVIRSDRLVAVTEGEREVPFVVRARIVRP